MEMVVKVVMKYGEEMVDKVVDLILLNHLLLVEILLDIMDRKEMVVLLVEMVQQLEKRLDIRLQ